LAQFLDDSQSVNEEEHAGIATPATPAAATKTQVAREYEWIIVFTR
jgi:hypothetical protein